MKKIILSICFACLCLASLAQAQTATAYPALGQSWQQALGYIPNTNTAVTTQDSVLIYGVFMNKSVGSVTITITDTTTNCGGSACPVWQAISIAAGTTYAVPFYGLLATGGVQWSASSSSAVSAWLRGAYTTTNIAEIFTPNAILASLGVPERKTKRYWQ